VDSNLLIQDLLNQINRLNSENTVLRVAVQQYQIAINGDKAAVELPGSEED